MKTLRLLAALSALTLAACGSSQEGAQDLSLSDEELRAGCRWDCPSCTPGAPCARSACSLECPGERCGSQLCAVGEVCCNDSCGICTPADGVCIQLACAADCSTMKCEAGQHCEMKESGETVEPVCVPDRCSRMACALYCPNGYVLDAAGCPTCACAEPVECPTLNCLVGCDYGYVTDPETRCQTCTCEPAP